MKHDPPQIVVLASGNGTTFEAILNAAKDGRISGTVRMLICNRKEAGVVERARRLGVEFTIVNNSGEPLFEDLRKLFESLKPDLIVLAGFMRILSADIIGKYGDRMINTHPALLPCFGGEGFYGDRVHKAVIESGAKISGCTVHFVTEEVDGGPIIAQQPVPVLDSDDYRSLAAHVHGIEKDLLVESIEKVLTVPYTVSGQRVLFAH